MVAWVCELRTAGGVGGDVAEFGDYQGGVDVHVGANTEEWGSSVGDSQGGELRTGHGDGEDDVFVGDGEEGEHLGELLRVRGHGVAVEDYLGGEGSHFGGLRML